MVNACLNGNFVSTVNVWCRGCHRTKPHILKLNKLNMSTEHQKNQQPCTIHSVMASGLLFNQFERETIRKYNGIWGWKTPDYAPSIIIRYNLLKIQKELIRVLRVRQIVEWLSNHLP